MRVPRAVPRPARSTHDRVPLSIALHPVLTRRTLAPPRRTLQTRMGHGHAVLLRESAWGNGYAAEATRGLLGYSSARLPDDATLRECWARTRERHFRAPSPARSIDHKCAGCGSPRGGSVGRPCTAHTQQGAPPRPETFP
jgi:hypothetical protein